MLVSINVYSGKFNQRSRVLTVNTISGSIRYFELENPQYTHQMYQFGLHSFIPLLRTPTGSLLGCALVYDAKSKRSVLYTTELDFGQDTFQLSRCIFVFGKHASNHFETALNDRHCLITGIRRAGKRCR